MDRKIISGVFACGVAMAFWACGSGQIYEPDDGDKLLGWVSHDEIDPDTLAGLNISYMKSHCKECFAESSSSSVKGRVKSSSSRKTAKSSSSSSAIPEVKSSSVPEESSSSSEPAVITGDNGTCAAISLQTDSALASVPLDEKIYWKYTAGGEVSAMDLLKSSFKWSTPGASSETYERTGSYGMNDTVAYATKGEKTANLLLTTAEGKKYSVDCSPLQVNGRQITGCNCTTKSPSVNYFKNPEVSWSVSGCSTGEGQTLSYEWNGTLGGTIYTKTFNTEHSGYVPKLKVTNDDSVSVVVNCPEVQVNGVEYVIEVPRDSGAIDFPEGEHFVAIVGDESVFQCTLNCRATGNFTVAISTGDTLKGPFVAVEAVDAEVCKGKPVTMKFSRDTKCSADWF